MNAKSDLWNIREPCKFGELRGGILATIHRGAYTNKIVRVREPCKSRFGPETFANEPSKNRFFAISRFNLAGVLPVKTLRYAG